MVYIDDWAAFYAQAEALVLKHPLRTRYVLKYVHSEGKLVLKVTDDIVCLKYRTDQQVDLRKMEKLNSLFFAVTARGERPTEEELAATAEQLGSAAAAPAASSSRGRGGSRQGGSTSKRKG